MPEIAKSLRAVGSGCAGVSKFFVAEMLRYGGLGAQFVQGRAPFFVVSRRRGVHSTAELGPYAAYFSLRSAWRWPRAGGPQRFLAHQVRRRFLEGRLG